MTFVAELEPQGVWKHFDRILAIPRASKHEEAARRYAIQVAEGAGLDHRSDAVGNLVVAKPAARGNERAPVTVLQSHLDMVEEKNSDVAHDFRRDPIRPRRDGDYLTASGTTLGSDNGIGVAAMLALAEAEGLPHGPLELLFTVDEESGLTGASQLDPALLTGRRLLNLDAEEEGSVYVGCAGGADSTLLLPLEIGPAPQGIAALEVGVAGLRGGHSGVDIHLQRGNAVKLLTRSLLAARAAAPFRVAALAGGDKHNAIPREAGATLMAEAETADALRDALEKEAAAIRDEYRPAEPELRFAVTAAPAPAEAWSAESSATALRLLAALPHGVVAMSYEIPDLVETSTNLATAARQEGSLAVLMSSRSSVASALADLRRRLRAIGELAGAEVHEGNGYPGWKPNLDSRLLATVRGVHRRLFDEEAAVKAIHAGLECGIIGEKVPGMDMISFGPQIEFPHSPDERVRIDSVGRFWRLLTAVLEELGTG